MGSADIERIETKRHHSKKTHAKLILDLNQDLLKSSTTVRVETVSIGHVEGSGTRGSNVWMITSRDRVESRLDQSP